ncbi:MAG: RNA polymerase sigma factor SigM [Gordonia sp. (in: high G+C Gram-positive bacteria)]|uniref:RNA polymerase sigma factor SigM n=1 Tax=Gordonia sp. (in: high G+C Gram-positive bacteria) TaxID=84139 RepID=UPI0039E3985E
MTSDSDLLTAGAAGDGSAFGELIDRHQRYLWSVALRTSGDPDDAADGLQDALLNIVRMARAFRADATVQCWMHRIVVNACLDRRRRRKCHDAAPLPEHDNTAPLIDRTAQDFTDHVDLELSIGKALDVLPSAQRDAIIYVDVQGRSVQEAADLLGIAPGTVKSRCNRGRTKLKMVLGHLRDYE